MFNAFLALLRVLARFNLFSEVGKVSAAPDFRRFTISVHFAIELAIAIVFTNAPNP